MRREKGALTAKICAEARIDVDLDKLYSVNQAGYRGDDAADYNISIYPSQPH